MSKSHDSFGTKSTLSVSGDTYQIAHLPALEKRGHNLSRLPYSIRILLENLLRREDGDVVPAKDIEAVINWNPKKDPDTEIQFMPARVILQDFTGVPAVVDLAAMRDAMKKLGGNPDKINPQQPVQLVIDHSVQVDLFGTPSSFQQNVEIEYQRNRERYEFLKWGQQAFENFEVVPPGAGIVHQVNLEKLASVVMTRKDGWAVPDTVVGTDSHTTMINGLAVLGWGVGGIEAEAAMLGQPVSMLLPQVVGFELNGRLAEGATATDLVLTVTQMLRKKGVVGKFVEFYGKGLEHLSLADRATIANMAPEYGATCGIFAPDKQTMAYLQLSGRSPKQLALIEAYMKHQGLWWTPDWPTPEFSDTLSLDLGSVKPSLAGPKRPQDRIELTDMKAQWKKDLPGLKDAALKVAAKAPSGTVADGKITGKTDDGVSVELGKDQFTLTDGAVVIAAITSCTNTSNPSVMIGAGLLAKKAHEKGLTTKPWVKTSLAPGSQVVTDYLTAAKLMPHLEALRFHLVGYGCTTCIGNSGPLPPVVGEAVDHGQLVATSVLSGNRNFEGRVNPQVRANYLASPPLVVAYAIAGTVNIDLSKEPLGKGSDGKDVFLKDIWPSSQEITEAMKGAIKSEMFVTRYAKVFEGEAQWQALKAPTGSTFSWNDKSTYVQNPPYFDGITKTPPPVKDITSARVLAYLGDSITTDHISPAGSIKADSPAGKYLQDNGVKPADFNQYGTRRGNHQVMMRGTFANTRIKNRLVPHIEGGYTKHLPSGAELSIYDAAMKYKSEGVATVIFAGKEYGSGSSRDWAAKGPMLQGVSAVIAESFERIHRSNLVGMGILPLEFLPGQTAESLGLTGTEVVSIAGIADGVKNGFAKGRELTVVAKGDAGEKTFKAKVRIDTPQEIKYYQNGGILSFVLRQLAES